MRAGLSDPGSGKPCGVNKWWVSLVNWCRAPPCQLNRGGRGCATLTPLPPRMLVNCESHFVKSGGVEDHAL